MLEDIKVSIILPIYNVEKYIKECLDSILSQTHKNLEIILVDDGSPDLCGKIIDGYAEKDERIRMVHKKNGGVSSARNEGLKIATGEYICFADPDDYLMNDYVDYLLELALQNNAGIALSKDMYSSFDKKETSNNSIEMETPEKITVDILMHKVPIGVYCKIFKRSLLDEYKIKFREDIFIGEGFNFNTLAFQRANKIAVGYKRIYFYRTDNQNSAVSKFNGKKWENALYALDCIESDLTIKTKLICNAINYAKWFDGCFILSRIARNNAFSKCKDLTNKCKSYVRKYFKYVFKTETSLKQKIKALMFYFTPIVCSKIFYGR